MDLEKTGKFIAELRKEKNLSQQELADLIPISREAISKWERGKNGADNSSLLRLSEIFNVSINEILYGEKKNKNNESEIENVSLVIYEKNLLLKKYAFLVLTITTFIILIFLTYYFINTYNSIKVYTISSNEKNITIRDGLFVTTKNKLYFNISNIETNYDITGLSLYYDNVNDENLIYRTDGKNIILYDFYEYSSFFEYKNISNIINNLYLKIEYENNFEIVKLNLKKDFSNNKISISRSKENNNKITTNIESNDFRKLVSKLNSNNNTYNIKGENQNINLVYFPDTDSIYLQIIEKNQRKEWLYYMNFEYIEFSEYDDNNNNLKNSFTYNKDDNIDENNKNSLEEFYNTIENILKS